MRERPKTDSLGDSHRRTYFRSGRLRHWPSKIGMMMDRNDALEWMEIGAATTTLAWEAAGVVALRMAEAANGGPNAHKEAWRMCSEKAIALAELYAGLLTGSLGATPAAAARETVKHYRRK